MGDTEKFLNETKAQKWRKISKDLIIMLRLFDYGEVKFVAIKGVHVPRESLYHLIE